MNQDYNRDYYAQYEPLFGVWHITRQIGEGSFGRVFELEREDFGQTYKSALKAITVPASESELREVLAEGMSDQSARDYFGGFVGDLVKEFALMSRLKGTSNVVSYENHQVIEHRDGVGWDILIQMELLTPLNEYIQEQKITRQDVIKLGIHMCRALELCQRYNIIHRDIKPENIFLSENGDFKLGDFGIARTVEKTTGGLSKKGTYNYMAPEVYRGEPYGSTVDIYSLGIVLYRLLNENRLPFLPAYPAPITHADRENALVQRMGGTALPLPVHGEGRLGEIVLRACAYRSADRYSSPAQMRKELEAIAMNGNEAGQVYFQENISSRKSVEYKQTTTETETPKIAGVSEAKRDLEMAEATDKTESMGVIKTTETVGMTGALEREQTIGISGGSADPVLEEGTIGIWGQGDSLNKTGVPVRKRNIRVWIMAMAAVAVLAVSLVVLIAVNLSSDFSGEKEGGDEKKEEEEKSQEASGKLAANLPGSAFFRDFLEVVFEKPVEEITEQEISSITAFMFSEEDRTIQYQINYGESISLTFQSAEGIDWADLKCFSGLAWLSIEDKLSAGDLEGLTNLYSVAAQNSITEYLDIIPYPENIQQLWVEDILGTEYTLDGIEAFPNLQLLSVNYRGLIYLDALRNLPDLTTLQLLHCEMLIDYEPLGDMENLVLLAIESCGITDIYTIADIASLTSLSLVDNENLQDYRPIGWMTNLKELQLVPGDDANMPSGVLLMDLQELEYLDIRGTALSDDIEFILGLPALRQLSLLDCTIGEVDFGLVADNRNLETLYLGGTWFRHNSYQFSDLLSHYPNLTYLDLSYTGIENLDFVELLPDLIQLDITGNRVTSLKPLENLKYLQTVWCGDNPIGEGLPEDSGIDVIME